MWGLFDRTRLWLGWIIAASAFFTLVPAGPFGLLGWLAATGPLLRRVLPTASLGRVAAVVLFAMAVVLVIGSEIHWIDVPIALFALMIGLLLAPFPGYTDTGSDPVTGREVESEMAAFELALAREIARARRHERPITVFQASTDPPGRDMRSLEAVINSEIHIYAQSFRVADALLVIVPELDAAAWPALERRLLTAAAAHGLTSLYLGAVSFPDEEITATGLLAAAQARCRPLHTDGGASDAPAGIDATARNYRPELPTS